MIPSPFINYQSQASKIPSQQFNNLLFDQQQSWDPGSSIDWNFINELDPILIKKTKDVEALQKLMNSFAKISISPTDTNLFSHPLAPRLFQLIQVLMDYLLFCKKQIDSKLEDKSEENEKLKKKIKILESSNQKLEISYRKTVTAYKQANVVIDQLRQPRETCPVCKKRFKEGNYLDKHFESKHNELFSYWKAIRTQQPINVANNEIKELIDQIKELKQQTSERKKKFEESHRKIKQREIENEDPLMCTHEELNAQLCNAAENLDSSMQLYRNNLNKSNKKKKKSNINTANPFSQYSQQPQNYVFQQQTKMVAANMPTTTIIPETNQNYQVHTNLPHQTISPTLTLIPQPQQIPQPIPQQQINEEPVAQNQISSQQILQQQPNQQIYDQSPPIIQQQQQQQVLQQPQQTIEQQIQQNQVNVPQKEMPFNNPTLLQARNFLNPAYREAKFKITEEQLEKMISTVTNRIQNEIAEIKSERGSNDVTTSESPSQKSVSNSRRSSSGSNNSRRRRRKVKQSQVTYQVLDSSAAEYSPFVDLDANCSYNENSDDEDSISQNRRQLVIKQRQQQQQKVQQHSVKQQSDHKSQHRKRVTFHDENNNSDINIQTNNVVTKPKKAIHIPEEPKEPEQPFVLGVKFIQHYQPIQRKPIPIDPPKKQSAKIESQSENSSFGEDNFVVESENEDEIQSKPSKQPSKVIKNEIQKEKPECLKITNEELDELLAESSEQVEKPKVQKNSPKSNVNKNNSESKRLRKPPSPKITETKITNSELDEILGSAASEKPKKSDSKPQKTTNLNYGVKITNSELEELLCDSDDKNFDNSLQHGRSSTRDTFIQDNSHSPGKITQDDIDALLEEENEYGEPIHYDERNYDNSTYNHSNYNNSTYNNSTYNNSAYNYSTYNSEYKENNEYYGNDEYNDYHDDNHNYHDYDDCEYYQNYQENDMQYYEEYNEGGKYDDYREYREYQASQLKELPKPPKMNLELPPTKNKDKFDLSYLNDIPGPNEDQKWLAQKKRIQNSENHPGNNFSTSMNSSATKGRRLLQLGALSPKY